MRTLLWIFRFFVFVFLLAFAVMNSDPVSLRFFFDTQWQAPLVIVLLGFFAGGTLLGVLSLLGVLFQLRRELTRCRRELVREQNKSQPVKKSLDVGGEPPAAGEAVAQ